MCVCGDHTVAVFMMQENGQSPELPQDWDHRSPLKLDKLMSFSDCHCLYPVCQRLSGLLLE